LRDFRTVDEKIEAVSGFVDWGIQTEVAVMAVFIEDTSGQVDIPSRKMSVE